MTELGYSSFLRGCETYAIYDKSREEFIINSASILATKWWIGMAGDVRSPTNVAGSDADLLHHIGRDPHGCFVQSRYRRAN
jgi:hypothetical protein